MTTTIDLTYNQILDIVMQMPLQDRKRLSDELNSLSALSLSEDLTPYTMAELNSRIDEAEDDILNGRTVNASEGHKLLEEKYPWLCK